MPSQASSTQRLAAIHLGTDPGKWINDRRSLPDPPSWRLLAYEMAAATGGKLTPAEQTIRTWHRQWVEREFVDRVEAEVGGAA